MPKPMTQRPLHLALNREGALFVFFWLTLTSAAIYSGKSGLVLLMSAISASLALAYFIARRNFQTMHIERRFKEDIFAGRETQIDLFITNTGHSPVFGLLLFERFSDNHVIGPIFIRRLNPGQTVSAHYMCMFSQRGRAFFQNIEIRSRFPLPFVELRQTLNIPDSACVYPTPIPGDDELTCLNTTKNKKDTQRKDHALKELNHGVRRGHIAWKISARRQKWIEDAPMRSGTHEISHAIRIRPYQELGAFRYERQLSQATALVLDRIRHQQSGSVLIGNKNYLYGQTHEQRKKLLDALALG